MHVHCRHFQQSSFSNFELVEKAAGKASVTIGVQPRSHYVHSLLPPMLSELLSARASMMHATVDPLQGMACLIL